MVYPGVSVASRQRSTLTYGGHSARETDFVLDPSCNQGLKIAVQAHRSKQAGRPPEQQSSAASPPSPSRPRLPAWTPRTSAAFCSSGGRGQREGAIAPPAEGEVWLLRAAVFTSTWPCRPTAPRTQPAPLASGVVTGAWSGGGGPNPASSWWAACVDRRVPVFLAVCKISSTSASISSPISVNLCGSGPRSARRAKPTKEGTAHELDSAQL